MRCRFCDHPLSVTFCDLGHTPLANAYPKEQKEKEPRFPLHTYVCEQCFLVQLPQWETPSAIFSEYAYFSSFSSSWLEHAKRYADKMRPLLPSKAHIVEIASNDGYLLQHLREYDILGIEPAENVADAAIAKGIPTLKRFFGSALAKELAQADLIIGNNVLAHVPNLNDFVAGLKILLKPKGIITLEFPHLYQLMQQTQFDTIYHEHFSYFSLTTLQKVFAHHALQIYAVEELPTHGGSLRLFLRHPQKEVSLPLKEPGFDRLETYTSFAEKVHTVRKEFTHFLQTHKKIAAYGAPAKGNTFLNYCGVTADQIPFTVDKNPYKQGRYLPGTAIPIADPKRILEEKPDFILILPWNLKQEVMEQMQAVRTWGGRFVTAIPHLECL